MSRSPAERARAVRAVMAAARDIAARAEEVASDLAASTGLSREGVLLALREHLELDATDAEIASLVQRAGDAPRVHVILSANVFVGALRAIAIACAAAPIVTVRPSRRDPWFARALALSLASAGVRLGEDIAPLDVAAGQLHVYGHDETIARVRAAARPGVRVVGHGAGMGIAWVAAADDLALAAAALAHDVVAFDQRGCLSPRAVLVAGATSRASELARELDLSLKDWETRVPRGVLSETEAAERARWLETLTFAGEVRAAPAHAVAVAPEGSALPVPPPGRHVQIAPIAGPTAARALLAPLARAIVAVGANDAADARAFAPPHARISPLGRMQRPPLDGPVDGRTG